MTELEQRIRLGLRIYYKHYNGFCLSFIIIHSSSQCKPLQIFFLKVKFIEPKAIGKNIRIKQRQFLAILTWNHFSFWKKP